MSRNLARTDCRQCDGVVKLVGVPRRQFVGTDWSIWAADAECVACDAQYAAWIGPTPDGDYGSRMTDKLLLADHGFYDLSYRSTFNDEPGPTDIPPSSEEWQRGFRALADLADKREFKAVVQPFPPASSLHSGVPFVSASCEGEKCFCGDHAEHKVEETIFADDPLQQRHPLTAYVCHKHFRATMGPAADNRIMVVLTDDDIVALGKIRALLCISKDEGLAAFEKAFRIATEKRPLEADERGERTEPPEHQTIVAIVERAQARLLKDQPDGEWRDGVTATCWLIFEALAMNRGALCRTGFNALKEAYPQDLAFANSGFAIGTARAIVDGVLPSASLNEIMRAAAPLRAKTTTK